MIELIENIAKAIVDKPDQVRVSGVEGENSIVIELRVAKEDIGKVIGKNGRTITAMRTILNATRENVPAERRAELGTAFLREREKQLASDCGSIENVRKIVGE